MKRITLTTLAVLALIATPDTRADVAPDEFIGPVPVGVALDISDSLYRLDALAAKGEDLAQELEILEHAIAGIPTLTSLRVRLSTFVQQLSERARQTFIDERDAALLRQQFVQARLDIALAQLAERARGGGWTAEQYQTVLSQWIARARVFVDAPDPSAYRARIQSALDTAYKNAVSAAQIVMSMRAQMAEARVIEAQSDLARRVKDKVAIAQDHDRVVQLTIQLKRVLQDADFDANN